MKQDSKQVQVDLQDLGYETCGRSENEAEREESTSPGRSVGAGLTCPPTSGSCWLVPLLMGGRVGGVVDGRRPGPERGRTLWQRTLAPNEAECEFEFL